VRDILSWVNREADVDGAIEKLLEARIMPMRDASSSGAMSEESEDVQIVGEGESS